MTPERCREIMLCQEGMALENVGRLGASAAADMIRSQIDGLFNALCRIDGAERAANYALALGDRVCGDVREVTAFWSAPKAGGRR